MTQIAKTEPLPEPPRQMTFEEFLAWADEDTHAEWVDGEIIFMSPSEDIHQILLKWLIKALDEYVTAHDLGLLLPAPFLMRLASRPSGREPDVLFVAKENLGRNKRTYLDGPADLVIEIVCPDSQTRDRVDKLREYQQAGVREYWLIDPRSQQAEFYQLGTDGSYRSIPIREDGIYHSAVLEGLWLKVSWLWEEPLPPLLSVLKEWGLI
ncbi:MAG TPA: Uma2 family endonuclease [Chthonomonadaceae bacterium]|nr:Uma2 family endonuclease [Chthonomonadaceae bacterium]